MARIETVTSDGAAGLLAEVAAEIYLRAQHANDRAERMALKGFQHSIERVLERHGYDAVELDRQRRAAVAEASCPAERASI